VTDEADFNARVEGMLTNVTRIIALTMKTPLLVVDLFRNSTLTSMISEGGLGRRYLGPQSLLVVAFLLRVCDDYLPHRVEIFERKVLMPEVIEREKFHYLLEFFLWFAIFSLVRTAIVSLSRSTGREKKFFEQILGYATAVPLILLASDQVVETLLTYVGWEKVSGGGYWPEIDLLQLAIFAPALLGATVAYPFALLYRANRRVAALDPEHAGRKHPLRWALWRAGVGTVAVLAAQVLFAWSPDFINKVIPEPVVVEILEMHLTSKPTVATAFPAAMSLKITNRSDEDVFVEVSGMKLFAEKHPETAIDVLEPREQFIKIGKESSEVISVKGTVRAPREANWWTVMLPVKPAMTSLSISNAEPFLFWPPMDECFGEQVTHPCADVSKH
jgi:hypothetical protein